LSSPVLKWPDAGTVAQALRAWAEREGPRHPGLLRLGYFGSYARGDWGVGSDLDLIAIVASTPAPFERRSLEWETSDLPVPADLAVYTSAEWERLEREGSRFAATVLREAVWLINRG
jgi:predicted nucleotidyltransferase